MTALSIKEFLLSSKTAIETQLNGILSKITNEDSISTLLQSYQFNKNIQNLFGLLLYWKNSTEKSIHAAIRKLSFPHSALCFVSGFFKAFGHRKKSS